MSILSLDQWEQFLSNQPDAHILQTAAWGELKSAFGWEAVRLEVTSGGSSVGAQILFRRLPLGLTFAYIPKGPLWRAETGGSDQGPPNEIFWTEVDLLCRTKRAVFLKVEPDDFINDGSREAWVPAEDFQRSLYAIQPARTIVVDLHGDEDSILARMKQKTRYNIRLASKRGVNVYPSNDVELFFNLMLHTGERDEFGIHSLDYYRRAYDLFHPRDMCELLLAEYEGEPLAALMVFAWGSRAWYFYGASASLHRERMPTYLLQWEAMKWARAVGCTQYDLWGIPDYDQEILEAEFGGRSDGLWGIYRFKRGFGGSIYQAAPPLDRIYQPLLYRLYLRWMKRGSSEL